MTIVMVKHKVWWVLFDDCNQGMPTVRLFAKEEDARKLAEEVTSDFGGLDECPEALGCEEVELDE